MSEMIIATRISLIYLNQELKVMKVNVHIDPDLEMSTPDAKKFLKT